MQVQAQFRFAPGEIVMVMPVQAQFTLPAPRGKGQAARGKLRSRPAGRRGSVVGANLGGRREVLPVLLHTPRYCCRLPIHLGGAGSG